MLKLYKLTHSRPQCLRVWECARIDRVARISLTYKITAVKCKSMRNGIYILCMRHSRPQSPSFLGHVVLKRGVTLVGYKLSWVALGTRMRSRGHEEVARSKMLCAVDYKQLLDEVFVISGIIKVEVSVISRSRRLRLITLTEVSVIGWGW